MDNKTILNQTFELLKVGPSFKINSQGLELEVLQSFQLKIKFRPPWLSSKVGRS